MKILITSEGLEELHRKLREKGHEVYSCFEGFEFIPEWHIYADAFESGLINGDRCFMTAAGAEHWVDGWDYVVVTSFDRYGEGKDRNIRFGDKTLYVFPTDLRLKALLEKK